MTTSKPQIVFANSAGIILDRPIECPSCHTMHYFLRNLNGRTTCLDCAAIQNLPRGVAS